MNFPAGFSPAALLALPLLFSAVFIARGEVRINEFMASNRSTIVPGAVAGTFDDWIELHNDGEEPADLSGWHLTDDARNRTKWTFPEGFVIPSGGYRIVFASGRDGRDVNGNVHTNFSLSAEGEYLGLFRDDLSLVSEFGPEGTAYPPQEADVSYGLKPGDGSPVYFATPTPLAANAEDGFLKTARVVASVKRGFYTAPFSVELSTATPGAAIYYTLNGGAPVSTGGTPAASALLYTEPIRIESTTVLRAVALKEGYEPGTTETRTYIFPQAVATQTRPPGYPTAWGAEPKADYDVDPLISQSEEDGERFQKGLRDLPSLSISADMSRLFGPSGLYSRPTDENLEVAVSMEYFQPPPSGEGALNNGKEFQIDCGLRVQGGSSRNPNSSIKHSFSARFRRQYGAAKLRAELFGPGAASEFNSLQLRAMYNNSWVHGDAAQRARATLIRDQWMRDTFLEMGNADAGRGHYVHLFLNGLYWGVYNLHERVSRDHFAAYNQTGGADPDSIVVYNPGSKTPAEDAAFGQARSAVNSGNWERITSLLDVDSYIDFYILQHFGHNDDLKTDGNWRAAGGGPANPRWRFYPWDSERVLEAPENTGSLASSQDGANFIAALDHLPEFQARFADRAWKHLTHGGALTNARNRARFAARVAELDSAITGESARWGDDRSTTDYTRSGHWLKAVYGPLSVAPSGGVLGANGWFPESGDKNRTNTILAAWKTQRWPGTTVTKLPAVDPPAFAVNGVARHGGEIPPGGVLTLTGGAGELYVTTDGSDPRLTGGAVRPGLQPYVAGTPVPLAASGLVRARWFDGSRWSALNEAEFYLEPLTRVGDAARISEIHYHPAEPSAEEREAAAALSPPRVFQADDFQFLEIVNAGAAAVNLAGARLTGGVEFTFGNTPLPPGGRVVVVENAAAFALRYGDAVRPAGEWSGALARSGETLTLLAASGETLMSVTYGDSPPWPKEPDGGGSSLEMIDEAGDPADPGNWRASAIPHGTPGAPNGGPVSGGFDAWLREYPGAGGPADDPDRDGLPNLGEYALGLDPLVSNAADLPRPALEGSTLVYVYPRVPERGDVTVTVQRSTNLTDWSDVPAESVTVDGGGAARRVALPVSQGERVFLRLKFNR